MARFFKNSCNERFACYRIITEFYFYYFVMEISPESRKGSNIVVKPVVLEVLSTVTPFCAIGDGEINLWVHPTWGNDKDRLVPNLSILYWTVEETKFYTFIDYGSPTFGSEYICPAISHSDFVAFGPMTSLVKRFQENNIQSYSLCSEVGKQRQCC